MENVIQLNLAIENFTIDFIPCTKRIGETRVFLRWNAETESFLLKKEGNGYV